MNQEIVNIINKLKRFLSYGYMDEYEIQEVIDDLNKAYRKDNIERLNQMMEDVTIYMSKINDENVVFLDYVKANIEAVASLLNKSNRTIYRKIQNNSFTLVEKRIIEEERKRANPSSIK